MSEFYALIKAVGCQGDDGVDDPRSPNTGNSSRPQGTVVGTAVGRAVSARGDTWPPWRSSVDREVSFCHASLVIQKALLNEDSDSNDPPPPRMRCLRTMRRAGFGRVY